MGSVGENFPNSNYKNIDYIKSKIHDNMSDQEIETVDRYLRKMQDALEEEKKETWSRTERDRITKDLNYIKSLRKKY